MATTNKIVYRNYCVPQEQIQAGGKFYLDSDCGRKLSGSAEVSAAHGALTHSLIKTPITDSAISWGSGLLFVHIKNIGGDEILLSLDGGTYYLIKLSEGEAFTSETSGSASWYAKCASGETATLSLHSAAAP